jgi:hypothetical protein
MSVKNIKKINKESLKWTSEHQLSNFYLFTYFFVNCTNVSGFNKTKTQKGENAIHCAALCKVNSVGIIHLA